MLNLFYPILLVLPVLVFSLERGDRCVTPNGESAKCTAVRECPIILNAITKKVEWAVSFASKSQCGYDSEPLVCCGSLDGSYGWENASYTEKVDTCTTPNGENATCIPISACKVLEDGLLSLNNTITQFILKSKCGSTDDGPLVCCGSTNVPNFSLRPLQHKLLPDTGTCGKQHNRRIYGGDIADLDEFPWMALLGYKNTRNGEWSGFKCGGTVISRRYVLTAAHCINAKRLGEVELEKVRLGEWRISTELDCVDRTSQYQKCADPQVDVYVAKTIPHPNYRRKAGDDDIGLIRLASNIQFTYYIKPICLPSFEPPIFVERTKLFTCGWGRTEYGSLSDIKMKLEVPPVSNTECKEKVKDRGLISDRQLCAGGVIGKDTCTGDSGGPLMIREKGDEQWYQVGVTSWGVGCANSIPGVYTKVSGYLNWIMDNMEEF